MQQVKLTQEEIISSLSAILCLDKQSQAFKDRAEYIIKNGTEDEKKLLLDTALGVYAWATEEQGKEPKGCCVRLTQANCELEKIYSDVCRKDLKKLFAIEKEIEEE